MNSRSLYYDLLTLGGIFLHGRPGCGPRVAQINISDDCNLDCAICNRSSMGVSGLLAEGRILSLVDELYSLGTQEVFFHGFGEPACHPRLPSILRTVKSRCPALRQHLITNGAWDHPDLLDAIVHARVGTRFSLHAGDADTWQRVHPRDNVKGFEQAGTNLIALTSRQPERVEILYVICKTNCGGIREMASYASAHGVRRILFRPMRLFRDRRGQYMNSSLLPDADEFRKAADTIRDLQKQLSGRMSIQAIPFEENSHDPGQRRPSSRGFYLHRSCYIGYVLAVVERDGNVWGCLPESSDGVPLGNIARSSFRKIWYGPEYDHFRKTKLFEDKALLDGSGCHSYCQHLETNVRLNRLKPWRRFRKPGAGGLP